MAKELFVSNQNVVDKVIEEVTKILGDGVTVTATCVTKTNVIKNGLVIKSEDSNIAPTIYLEEFMVRLQDDESDEAVLEVANAIADVYRRSKIDEDYDCSWFLDFEQVRDRLRIKLLNTAWNQEILKDVPSVPFLDLSMVLYCVVPEMNRQSGSILIHKNHLECWKQDIDSVFKAAMENTAKDYEIKSITAVLREMMGDVEFPFDEMPDDMMYVLTNKSKFQGSVLFTIEDVLSSFVKEQEAIRGKKIDKVLIIPSSLHETLLICSSGDSTIEEMDVTEMIRSVNNDCVNAEDVLSDHPYMYVVDEHKIISID